MSSLRNGDILLLKVKGNHTDDHVYAYCDGFVDETLNALSVQDTDEIPDIRNCLFRIVLKLSYSQAKDYDRKKKSGASASDLKALRESCKREEEQNALKLGHAGDITYGESVQLQHIKSGKFVSVVPRSAAINDREARLVEVREGNAHCAFRVQQYYKYKFPGEQVSDGDQVLFQAWKMGTCGEQWNLRTDSSGFLPSKRLYEVHCSTKDTDSGFQLKLYAHEEPVLMYSATVRLRHAQTETVLGASCQDAAAGEKLKAPYFRQQAQFTFAKTENLWSKGLWILEPLNKVSGGAITWKKKGFRLKHMGSGAYLSIAQEKKKRSNRRGSVQPAQEVAAEMTRSAERSCLFCLHPVEDPLSDQIQLKSHKVKGLLKVVSSKDQKQMEAALQRGGTAGTEFNHEISDLEDRDLWLAADASIAKQTNNKSSKKSLELFFTYGRLMKNTVLVDVLGSKAKEYVRLVDTMISKREYFKGMCERLRQIPRSLVVQQHDVDVETAAVLKHERRQRDHFETFDSMNRVLSNSISLLAGEEIADPFDDLKAAKPHIQLVAKELKFIDSTVALKDALWSNGYSLNKLSSRCLVDMNLPGQVVDTTCELDDDEMMTHKLIIVLWRACFMNNEEVESYFSSKSRGWLEMLGGLNGLGLGAAKTFSSLIKHNAKIVEDMDSTCIEQFIGFIKKLGPDTQWTEFLHHMCYSGKCIVSKQQLILRAMYDPGENLDKETHMRWAFNREQVLIATKLGDPTNRFPQSIPPDAVMEAVDPDIRDIWVCWQSEADPWHIHCDWFYYHPDHLGLQVKQEGRYPSGAKQLWVSLHTIAWVLEPERFHDVQYDSKFKALAILAKFYVAQLGLLAVMCQGRRPRAIASVEKEYSYELLVCALYNGNLPWGIREAYVNLLICVWQDRHPHYEWRLPNAVVSLGKQREYTFSELPQFEFFDDTSPSRKASRKFEILFYLALYHLRGLHGVLRHDDVQQNKYTTALMTMMLKLADYGFFCSSALVRDFMQVMLRCMDGRTDWLETSPLPEDGGIMSRDGTARTDGSFQARASSRGDASTPLLGGIAKVAWTRRRGPCCTPEPGSREARVGPAYEVIGPDDPDDLQGAPMPLYLRLPESSGEERYPPSKQNDAIMECKVSMLKLCNKVKRFALNHACNQIVAVFVKHFRGDTLYDGSVVSEEVFEEFKSAMKDREFDFDELSGTSLKIMLFDLLLYENAEIFSNVIQVLIAITGRVTETLDSVRHFHILTEKSELQSFDRLKRDIFRLAHLIQSRELWAFSDGRIDALQECKDLLTRLRRCCSMGGDDTDDDRPNSAMQDMMSNFSVGTRLVGIFEERTKEHDQEQMKEFLELVVLTIQFLAQYVNHHAKNQNEMFRHLDIMNPYFSLGIGVSSLVAAIFTGNRRLCENLPLQYLHSFAQVLQENRLEGLGFRPQQVAFFHSVIAINHRPIDKNKAEVLKILRDVRYDQVMHLMKDEEGSQRRKQLLVNFHSWNELKKPDMFRKWHGDDAEIQYHNRCIELLAVIAAGKASSGAQSFVQQAMSATDVALEYLECDEVLKLTGGQVQNDSVAMCRSLKKSLLLLLEHAHYNSDIQDYGFLRSEMHFRLLRSMRDSIKRLEPALSAGRLEKLDAEFLVRILNTIVVYVEHGQRKHESKQVKALIQGSSDYDQDRESEKGQSFKDILQNHYDRMSDRGDLAAWRLPRQTLQENYAAAVTRALGFIKDTEQKNTRVLDYGDEEELQHGGTHLSGEVDTEELHEFVSALESDDRVNELINQERKSLIQPLFELDKVTSLKDPAYRKELEAARRDKRELDQFGFRRNQICVEHVVTRMVKHCSDPKHLKDWQVIQFCLNLFNDLLESKSSESEQGGGKQLENFQNNLAEWGVVKLIVDIMMSTPDSRIVSLALDVGIKLLEPWNSHVQKKFKDILYKTDDTELWKAKAFYYDHIISNLKQIRTLKQIQRNATATRARSKSRAKRSRASLYSSDTLPISLSRDEQAVLNTFTADLHTVKRAMRFHQCLCEGHFKEMQQYLYCQVDNSGSVNFIEKTIQILMKLCKSEKAIDMVDEQEAACIDMILELLVEVTTGPNSRNQDFISLSGFVEMSQKLLKGKLTVLRQATHEVYPGIIRLVKSKAVLLLTVLLETRLDTEVHQNILFRCDTETLRNRIVFVHRWFLAAPSGDAVVINDDTVSCKLDSPEEEDGVVVPEKTPFDVVADMTEEDIENHFSEAFNIMLLIRQLAEFDPKFKEAVTPKEAVSSRSVEAEGDEDDLGEAGVDFEYKILEQKYLDAHNFFKIWIDNVEIVIQDKIYDYYFRHPIVCTCVLGRAKKQIEDEVSVDSPEAKVRDFCSLVETIYEETDWARTLMNWGRIVPVVETRIKPFHFFLSNDSANLTLMEEFQLGVALSLNFCLFFALELPVIGDNVVLPTMGVNDGWGVLATLIGFMYGVTASISLLVVVASYAPVDYWKLDAECEGKDSRIEETARWLGGISFLALSLALLLRLPPLLYGFLIAMGFSLKLGERWSGAECPNNKVAKVTSVASSCMRNQAIMRRVFLFVVWFIGSAGVPYMYSFLLLDLIFLSPILRSVVRAVIMPAKSLMLTTMVGCIIMYQYALVAFHYFRQDYGGSCQTLLDCTTTTIYQGLRSDIADDGLVETNVFDGKHWYMRMGFDLSYFIVITTILMNVIMGLIIDTFGNLRDLQEKREEMLKNTTFISSISRREIDQKAKQHGITNGFAYLENKRQYKWAYMNFIFYLKSKDVTDFTGPETEIKRQLDHGDVAWLPRESCKLMEAGPAEPIQPQIAEIEASMELDRSIEREELALLKEQTLQLNRLAAQVAELSAFRREETGGTDASSPSTYSPGRSASGDNFGIDSKVAAAPAARQPSPASPPIFRSTWQRSEAEAPAVLPSALFSTPLVSNRPKETPGDISAEAASLELSAPAKTLGSVVAQEEKSTPEPSSLPSSSEVAYKDVMLGSRIAPTSIFAKALGKDDGGTAASTFQSVGVRAGAAQTAGFATSRALRVAVKNVPLLNTPGGSLSRDAPQPLLESSNLGEFPDRPEIGAANGGTAQVESDGGSGAANGGADRARYMSS